MTCTEYQIFKKLLTSQSVNSLCTLYSRDAEISPASELELDKMRSKCLFLLQFLVHSLPLCFLGLFLRFLFSCVTSFLHK